MGKQPRKDNPTTRRSRSAVDDDKSERTGAHLRIADEIWWSLFLLAERQSTPSEPVTVRKIHEKALTWFLDHEAKTSYRQYMAPRKAPTPDRRFWLDSRLHERASKAAKRDEVALSRVIETAFHVYLQHIGVIARVVDIARLKAKQALNPERSWRVVTKAGSRYKSRVPKTQAAKR